MDRSYRFYELSTDHAIVGAECREFASDEEALIHARGLLQRRTAVEVWQTDRLVHRIERETPPARSAEVIRLPVPRPAPSAPSVRAARPVSGSGEDPSLAALVHEITEAWRTGLVASDRALRWLGDLLGLDAKLIDRRLAADQAVAGAPPRPAHAPQPFVVQSCLERLDELLQGPLPCERRALVEVLRRNALRVLAQVEAGTRGAGPARPAGPSLHGRPARLLDAFENSAKATLLLCPKPGLHIIDVNPAYARVSMVERNKAAGERLFDLFPDNPDQADADGVSNLYASLRRVAETGRPDAMPKQRYDVRENGVFVERYWRPLNTPLFDEQGRLKYIVHQVQEARRENVSTPGLRRSL